MVSEKDRLAHIFIWKQAGAPDIAYARRLLSAVNPDAVDAIAGENPPVRLFTVFGPWPANPWEQALTDMRSTPTPDGSQWADATRYDLAGWEGIDEGTGERIFMVTAYSRATPAPAIPAMPLAPAPETFTGASTLAPSYIPPAAAVPQVPYYPQRPTGPLDWPPQPQSEPYAWPPLSQQLSEVQAFQTQPAQPEPPVPAQLEHHSPPTGPPEPGDAPYPYGSEYATNPIPAIPGAPQEMLPQSYAPPSGYASTQWYYVGFPRRLWAGLIDLAFIAPFELSAAVLYIWLASNANPQDVWAWLGAYSGLACLGLLIFAVYHVAQWTIWGQTLGKNLLGIEVVDVQGNIPGFGRALIRMMGYFFSLAVGGVGFLWIAFDPLRQGVHDKLAETYVVPEQPETPAPSGLPGYPGYKSAPGLPTPQGASVSRIATPMPLPDMAAAAVAATQIPQSYEVVQFEREQTAPQISSQMPLQTPATEEEGGLENVFRSNLSTTPNLVYVEPGLTTGPLTEEALNQQSRRTASIEKAREFFRYGMDRMGRGVQQSALGYKIDPASARLAALSFKEAVALVPNSVAYRYFYAVALRYAEGFEIAIREFRRVLELDPSHYEASRQVAYGPRWHDAFAYPPWTTPAPVEVGVQLPEPILALLPTGGDPVTRLVLVREGSLKVAAVVSRTPRSAWARPLTAELPAHIDMILSRTPAGPVIALYVVVEDKPDDPYKGETFLNPLDPGQPSYDACQLGQNLLAQIARQDRTYLIFIDENNRLLLSRKLIFDPQTQVSIARCLYEVQTLPTQVMDAQRFQQAAQWHMEHFSLDQVK